MGNRKIIITCEHAGNYVPKDYQYLFKGHEKVLESHRGWDPGAIEIAKYLARYFSVPMFFQKVSRLLVEPNRSLDNKELFSEFSQGLDKSVKKYVLNKYYHAYRNEVESRINKFVENGFEVIHVSIHSFTPVINGIERSVDLGILCDESFANELDFSNKWKSRLQDQLPDKVIMINVPYNGADDGFTTYLRAKMPSKQYVGIELEINQKYVGSKEMALIRTALASSLEEPESMAVV